MTEDHRFWSVTDDDWVELQDLDTSDVLLTPDGATVTVDFLDWDAGVTTDAYDLTVDQEHNFFVTADTTCLLYTSPSPRDRQKSRMPSSA